MKFNTRARLDTSQVSDRRRSGGSFPGGRGGMIGGGGAVAVIIGIVIALMGGGDVGGVAGNLLGELGAPGAGSATADNSELEESCRTGADAQANDDCTVVAIVNSVQAYWDEVLTGNGMRYRQAPTVFYAGSTSTSGCGVGQAAMGPFYCPADQTVYIDLSFWQELETQFGADASAFSQAYVIAHEYGHHAQNLLGTMDAVTSRAGAESDAVRLELQADCYAGAWANHASTVAGADGQVLITDITQQDIDNAVDTAGKIGDDWIQTHLGSGKVDSSTFTHGTTAQRQKWFTTGYSTGDPRQCDTFGAADLG